MSVVAWAAFWDGKMKEGEEGILGGGGNELAK